MGEKWREAFAVDSVKYRPRARGNGKRLVPRRSTKTANGRFLGGFNEDYSANSPVGC